MGKQGGKQDKSSDLAGNVVVAVKASKDMHKTALEWALTHVVQPGNRVTLLVVVCSHCYGRRFWGFSFFAGDCASGHGKCHSGATEEQKSDITDCCSQMILQLHDVYDPKKINVKIKIVSGTPCGAVAEEAKRASWVILDKHLKHEAKHCMEELKCNVAIMRHSQAKVLRLNLVELPAKEPESMSSEDHTGEKQETKANSLNSTLGPVVTPSSSSELSTPLEAKTSSASSSGPGTSPFFITEKENTLKTEAVLETKQARDLDESSLQADCKSLSSSSCSTPQRMKQIVSSHNQSSDHLEESPVLSSISMHSATKDILKKLSGFGEGAGFGSPSYKSYLDFNGNLREVISMLRPAPPGPPPLCSICQRKAPVLGKPPRWFTYAELELATGGFSQANFLAEGGFGSVHRGVLPDGQTVAVKQHKLASCQGDQEFCSEVEVLSCAQHRNVVMLIGFCIEDGRRLLVYEYICNGSLDYHLYGEHHNTLSWTARQKIAVGAARGLRYLHEECRVGCIVHRDMRPNNILITHDFESLVGDFGLARWQPDGQTGVETRVIGTFGYLAPEYTQSGQITQKADVYSFGVVLLELVTGRKAVELNRPKGQQCLTEWARSLLEAHADNELVDPRLGSNYSENEVYCMMHAAALCIHRDPHTRPRMSQVLRILEGDMMDSVHLWTNSSDVHQLKYGRSCSVESTDTA